MQRLCNLERWKGAVASRFRSTIGAKAGVPKAFWGEGAIPSEIHKARVTGSGMGKALRSAFRRSARGDYVAMVQFDKEYVETQLDRCYQFLKELRPLISEITRAEQDPI